MKTRYIAGYDPYLQENDSSNYSVCFRVTTYIVEHKNLLTKIINKLSFGRLYKPNEKVVYEIVT